jgi:acyl-CoA synthetase (AMP-forming)/AMP-acid ligase II
MIAVQTAPFSNTVETVSDMIRLRAVERPGQVAFHFLSSEATSTQMTYAALDWQAQVIAGKLLCVARPGERALLVLPSGADFVAAFAGCLYAGIVAVPVAVPRRNRPLDALLAIADDCEPTVAITTRKALSEAPPDLWEAGAARSWTWLPIDDLEKEGIGTAIPDPRPEPLTIAFLQYTSGSTSTPKGVMLNHRNLMHNQEVIRFGFGHNDQTRIVTWLPMFHDMGLIGSVLQPLYLGAPCVFLPPVLALQKPLRWLTAISDFRATTSGGPNFIYDLCVARIAPERLDELDLSSWEIAFNGSEPVRAETLDRFTRAFARCGFRARSFHPCYGLAEATLFVSGNRPGRTPLRIDADAAMLERHQVVQARGSSPARRLVGCGQRNDYRDVRVAIVDPESLRELPERCVGEIWIMGTSVAQGYWRRPGATAVTFQAKLESGEGSYLRSGDLGFIDGGELFVSGRLKDVLVLRGRNIYPQDIELAIQVD